MLTLALSSLSALAQSASRYAPDTPYYNPLYNDDLFYNDKNDEIAYIANAMWHMFGAIDDGQNLVYRFGNEPTCYALVVKTADSETSRQISLNEASQIRFTLTEDNVTSIRLLPGEA